MDRKYLKDLEDWLVDPLRKPLLVWGARQVGKTYLLRDIFAEKRFPGKYIYVDLAKDARTREYLRVETDVDKVISYLCSAFDMTIDGNTLIILDEAQECLNAITLMKYFCQEARHIPLIVTGSLVRMKLRREALDGKNFLFPVGNINSLYVYPLDFGEYLHNANHRLYEAVRKGYEAKKPLDHVIHLLAMDHFYDYLYLGGMPEVANSYLLYKDRQRSARILNELYDNYLSDMELYQKSQKTILRTRKVFGSIYSQLAKENKNFKCSLVEEGAKNRELRSPIDWLEFAFILSKSQPVKEKVTSPLSSSSDSLYRLYLQDNGIFTFQSGVRAIDFIDEMGRNSLSGIYFENYVAAEVTYHGFPLFYWTGKDDAEFEFLLETHRGVVPVDVKKKRGTLTSMKAYSFHNSAPFFIKISANHYGFDKDKKILTVPFYYLFLLLEGLRSSGEIPLPE